MKKIYIAVFTGLVICMTFAFNTIQAQAVLKSDTVIMGPSYANEIYYNLKNGEVSSSARDTWDIAFRTQIRSSSIITNDGTGIILWSYPKSDTSGWTSIDTSGLYSWTPMYNDPSDWENGAFGRNANGYPDYGWGKYNPATHDVVGDSLFIIQLRDGSFRKLRIIRKNSVNNIYFFRVANLDGSGQQDLSVNCNDFLTKGFIGFSLETNQSIDYQPVNNLWDIVFTKYMSVQPNGQPYPVTGVLSNDGVLSKNFHPVSLDYVDYGREVWDSTRSSIGWNWKYIDTNYSYHIVDSSVYFVKTLFGDTYKFVFTKFAGGSSGLIVFETAIIAGLGIQVTKSPVKLEVYPNPASDLVKVSFLQNSPEPAILELADLSGRMLLHRSIQPGSAPLSLDVSGLGTGVYFITILSSEGNISKKILINR